MPYIDQEVQKEYIRDWYNGEYAGNTKFREAEKQRQRELYEKNRERIIQRVMQRRAKLRLMKLVLRRRSELKKALAIIVILAFSSICQAGNPKWSLDLTPEIIGNVQGASSYSFDTLSNSQGCTIISVTLFNSNNQQFAWGFLWISSAGKIISSGSLQQPLGDLLKVTPVAFYTHPGYENSIRRYTKANGWEVITSNPASYFIGGPESGSRVEENAGFLKVDEDGQGMPKKISFYKF